MSIKNIRVGKLLSIIFCALSMVNGALAGVLGNSFVVNSYLPSDQNLVSASASANGDTMFLWSDSSKGAAHFLQRYDANGQPLTVGEYFVGNNAFGMVADRAGNFVITNEQSDGSGTGVFATLYARNGSVRVNTFRVNDITLNDQKASAIGIDANGNFAIAWMSFENNQWNTYVKQYTANGVARTSATKINTTSATLQARSIAIDTAGNVIVSGWVHLGQGNVDVWMRRISSSGALLGSQVAVNTYTTGAQPGGTSAINSSNSLVIVWSSFGQDGNGASVYGQKFNPDGSRAGTPFRISQTLSDEEPAPVVGMADDGSFVVTWYVDKRRTSPGSLATTYSRQFRADTTPVDTETIVNSIAGSKTYFPQIAMAPSGNYTIGWRDYNTSNNYDVAARRYVMDTVPPVVSLNSGQTVMGISGATGSWNYYKISIPAGMKNLNINMTGVGAGDGDLYIRFGALPTLTKWDIRPYLTGSNESASIVNPPTGVFYIAVYGYSAYPSISLTASYN